MTMPASGLISLHDCNTELGKATTGAVSLHDAVVRTLAGKPSGAISLWDLYGKSNIVDFIYDAPGTYNLTVPAGVTTAAVYLRAGSGGGAGGGGAGERDWLSSASGGGGGGGGAGEQVSSLIALTPGSTIQIIVGSGGGGGSGGSGAFQGSVYNGFAGSNGGNGTITQIVGKIQVNPGAGGVAGSGAPGDSPDARVSGGNGGGGYPAGVGGQYNHMVDGYHFGQYPDGTYTVTQQEQLDVVPNLAAGNGGSGGGSGGSGGKGGDWSPASFEYYPPNRIGADGIAGTGGYAHIRFSTSTLIVANNFSGYSSGGIAPVPPIVEYQKEYNWGTSCFPAGSMVLMGDMTWRAIETIGLSDMVMGMNGPEAITKLYTPKLGSRRMLRFANDKLRWSEEHSMWTRRNAEQWWWSANPEMWKAEVTEGIFGGLLDNNSIRGGLDDVEGIEWAHLSGWKNDQIIVEEGYAPDTQLYLPFTSGSPIIVDGYVVGGGANERNFNYKALNWDTVRATLTGAL